jgi:molybdopterin converting factor small subunit
VGEITVRVRVPAALRQMTAGRSTVDVRLGGDGTGAVRADQAPDVRALLDHLAASYPDLERRVRDEQGVLRRHVNVFVDTTNIRDLDEQGTVLADGDEVAILPAVSGGCSSQAADDHVGAPVGDSVCPT